MNQFIFRCTTEVIMNAKIVVGLCGTCVAIGGLWAVQQKSQDTGPVGNSNKPEQLVFIGDTQSRVYEMLGDPSIEFPEAGTMVQWYAGYEIVTSNNVVTYVRVKPVESEEERQEKELRAKLAGERLRKAYQAMATKEKISYNAWLAREEKRLQKEREERAAVEAYEERRSKEKKAAMYADAIKKSCGCTHRYCRHYHH
jgi:hypothetical protein